MPLKIALFDHKITPTNPIGGCHRRMLEGLCREHDFTVFAPEFENPCPEHIEWVRVPVPMRPQVALFTLFRLAAAAQYRAHCLRHGATFDLVQSTENYVGFGQLSYTQFCHSAFLKEHWDGAKASGLRGLVRWLDHRVRAPLEAPAFRRARRIVVPSHGLARELKQEFPFTEGKIEVTPNPIDVERMRRPDDFERGPFRQRLGFGAEDIVHAFVALGQFERKGLPLLLDALTQVSDDQKLLVVGGKADLVRTYEAEAQERGLGERAVFVGMQRDIRPYLWSADAFAFPSSYETFSLVAHEAAAAGLPLLITPLHGVEEFVEDGKNGIFIERTVASVQRSLQRFARMSAGERAAMAQQAQESVQSYAPERFVDAWRRHYAQIERDLER